MRIRTSYLPGYTLAEVLVVLAILSLATASSITVIRRPTGSDLPDSVVLYVSGQIANLRRKAVHSHELQTLVLPRKLDCGSDPLRAHPDGSVDAGLLCLLLENGEQISVSINPFTGKLTKGS